MTLDPVDFFAPPLGALLWLFLSWSYARSVTGGRPLNQVQRSIVLYGLWFVLGMGYVIMFGGDLRWPPAAIVGSIAIWGMVVAFGAFWHSSRRKQDRELPLSTTSSVRLKEWFPMGALLVCLVAAAVEWSLWLNGNARLLIAALWTAGIPTAIFLARQNRRTTVIVALRAFLGLALVGTLTQPSSEALIAVAATGVILLVLQRLWKKNKPSDLHLTLS